MGMNANLDKDTYFTNYELYSQRYLDCLIDKIQIYRRFCEDSGKFSKWCRALQNYYGISTDGTKSSNTVTRGGDSGQLTMAKVADYRNIIQHQLILITSQRPSGVAKAINSNPESLKEARIGSMLVEYYLNQVGLEKMFISAAERALVTEEAFAVLDWDTSLGDEIRPEMDENGEPTEKMIMSGDMTMKIFSAWNMARDPYLNSPEQMKWGIGSWRENKFDLCAKFQTHADAILKGTSRKLKEIVFNTINEDDTDQTEVHCLWHDKTPACPKGRITLFTTEEILLDGEFPYKEFNIYRMSQNDSIDNCFGYSNNNDLLALEEVTDALHSVVISNNTAFGAQAIIGPKGANLDHTQLAKGFAYFEVDPAHVDKIKSLQLTHTSAETFNYIERLDRKKETLGGIGSLVRGEPEGAIRGSSGSALALIQAQSIQYQSGGQRSFYQLLSQCCTGMILMLQRYADSERVIRITGNVQGQYLEELKYSSKSLSNISSVTFEMTNPLEKTIGGKEQIADTLLQHNLIKNARQYLTLHRTGSLDAFTEDDEADEIGVKSENQRLRDGRPVQIVKTENHEEHIQTHMSLIASPESKENGDLVAATLQHIDEHLATWEWLSMNQPSLLIATHQKVLPMPPMGMPPQGMPPGGPGEMPPPPGKGMPNSNPQPPAVQKAAGIQQPNLPKPPVNPLNGQRVPVPAGTSVK